MWCCQWIADDGATARRDVGCQHLARFDIGAAEPGPDLLFLGCHIHYEPSRIIGLVVYESLLMGLGWWSRGSCNPMVDTGRERYLSSTNYPTGVFPHSMLNLHVHGDGQFFRPAINSKNRRLAHQPTLQGFRARLYRSIPAGIRRAPEVSAGCVLCLNGHTLSTSGDYSGAGRPRTQSGIASVHRYPVSDPHFSRDAMSSTPCPPR